MIPDVSNVLGGIARALMFDLGPEVTSPYGSLTVQLGAGLLAMIAQESDRAAARLTAENDAILALFTAAEPVALISSAAASPRPAAGTAAPSRGRRPA